MPPNQPPYYHKVIYHRMDKQNAVVAVCVPIHNRSRYVDLEIEARIDEPIEDFV